MPGDILNTVGTLYHVMILLRLFRLIRLLDELESWKIMTTTMSNLIMPLFNVILVLYSLISLYAILGERIFGGLFDKSLRSRDV